MNGPKRNEIEAQGDDRAFGEVSFNYTSHDGRFMLGREPWLFETKWSQAGKGSAYLYNDPSGIKGVAIAEGVRFIAEVNEDLIARSDFTSRTRSPRVGQCAVIENQAGFFAAVQPLAVEYSAVPSENIMTIRFAIQRDRSANFAEFATAFDQGQSATDEIIRAADEAKSALSSVRGSEPMDEAIGIGHNQPPSEYALTEPERLATVEAVEIIRVELAQKGGSRERLIAAARTVASAAKTIGLWMAAKADVALDEFAKTVGKAAGVTAVVSLAAWVTLHGKLTVLAHLLASFAG
jgi:hypothetical protein